MKFNLKSELKVLIFALLVALCEVSFLLYFLNDDNLAIYCFILHFILFIPNLILLLIHRKDTYLTKLLILHIILFSSCFILGSVIYIGIFNTRFLFDKSKRLAPKLVGKADFLFFKAKRETLSDRVDGGLEDVNEYDDIDFYLDIIRYGNINQKTIVLNNGLNFYKPEFAPIFKVAINDESNMIRVQAATALTKIKERYAKEISKVQKKVLDKNGKILNYKEKTIRSSIKSYLSYYQSGILDQEEIKNICLKILGYYDKIDAEKYNIKDLEIMADLHVRISNYDKAYKILKKIFREKEGISQLSIFNYMKTFFYLGKFDSLRKFATLYRGKLNQDDPISVMINDSTILWARKDQ